MSDVFDRFLDRLTDNFNKSPNSIVTKLLRMTAYHIQENIDLLKKIGEWNDVDIAEGKALDRIGRNVQQERGQAVDEVYRILIKSKVLRNYSDGSINTIIQYLAFILQLEESEVVVKELWPEGKHATIHVNVPAGAIAMTGLSLTQFGRLVNLVTASGVRADVLFEGTFQLSDFHDESEFEATIGFASEDGTIGGELGYVYDPAHDIDLPI